MEQKCHPLPEGRLWRRDFTGKSSHVILLVVRQSVGQYFSFLTGDHLKCCSKNLGPICSNFWI